jgi:hypothetical protein
MKTRNILIFLLGFLGLGALYGGGVLIFSPSGELMGMPLKMLQYSPFSNFLIPGIILFFILGMLPIVVIYALIRKPEWRLPEYVNVFTDMHWAWTFSVYIAFSLIIWIQTEMMILKAVHWSHSLYIGIAIIILFVTILPQNRSVFKK